MWHEITNEKQIYDFMVLMSFFHDSCIKEMQYTSGAYVDEDLAMFPINNRRTLKVLIQRQSRMNTTIEMEFDGITHMKLFPIDESFTCEILEASLVLQDGLFYWSDSSDMKSEDISQEPGILICSSRLRWRSIDLSIIPDNFYKSSY